MKKRLLSALLVLCMVVGMLPASAMAEETSAQDYELRTLTFEDADYKGGENMVGEKDWSSLIDSSQFNGSLLYPTNGVVYNWYDEGNTYLKHQFTDERGDHKYWGGGEAISNYNSGDIETYGDFNSQLTVYKSGVEGLATTGGGHNGSNNFAVHYGYSDGTTYSATKLQALTFGDGVARVIDHMYVNNICYALNCYTSGNDLTASIGEDDWVKLVATGHHVDGTTATAEIYLCNGPDNIVTDWTKWDLSSLGEITKLELNVMGSSDNGYGFSQPAYFAYDDVAVRFPVAEAHTCAFDQKVVSGDYLATEADCTNAATYYYSCTCGEKGTETFSDGEALGHKDENSDRICDVCEENLNRVPVLVEGVTDITVKIQTNQGYQLKDLEGGKIFTDPDGDKLTYASYFYQKSSDGGETWGERTGFTASLYGGNDMTFVNDKEGTYIYKFWAYDGYGYSEETWTLTLIVMDVVPADINFYVGRDQNYSSNGNVYPVLELYRTAGIDDDFNDYIGWFVNGDGETVRIYNPHDYVITDGETDYVTVDGAQYVLHDYEKMAFTNSAFDAADETATASGTLVNDYNMFYVSLTTGRYSTRFYGYNTETSAYDIYLGGQSVALPMEKDIYGGGGNDLYFRLISVVVNSKKTDNTYFTADDFYAQITMPITGSNIQPGDPYERGFTYYPFMSWANGNGSLYNIYVYPYDTENYIFSQVINQTTAPGATAMSKYMTIGTATTLTVTVPKNGEFDLYFQYNNFNTKVIEPKETVVNDDGTTTLTYRVSKGNSAYTYRLTDLSGVYVTAARFLGSLSGDTEMTVEFPEETNRASHDFSKLNGNRDEADIHLFVTPSGFLSTASTTRVRAYRMWEIINSDTGNIMVEPDFNVQVLQGNAGDIVQVDGGNAGGNWLDVTPTTTDIVAVTYEALSGVWPATNPERTAVMVVTNEAAGTADATVRFNGSQDTSRGAVWDYNYDTWYYLNTDEKPMLDFTVSGTGDVSVSYATVITNSSLKSTLSGWTTVTADEDGAYHVGLLTFRNAGTLGGTVIIRMTDSTGTSYRLVRVAQMSIVSVENASFPGEALTPGCTATVTFDGLYRSVNKISGIFNPTGASIRYTAGETEGSGSTKQYAQMDTVTLTITIPGDVELDESGKGTYTFTNGYIYGSMYAAASGFSDMYRKMTDTGVGTNFSAVTLNYATSRLADFTVDVEVMSTFDVTLDVTDGENALTGYTFTLTDSNGEVVTPDDAGIYRDLKWGDYSYTLEKAGYLRQTGAVSIGSDYADKKAEDGTVHWAYTMVRGSEGCWDGTTSEPALVDGVYQIGTGAELAWFAEYVNAGNTAASAVLTADIDLAAYEWTPIGNSSAKFAGSFDGQNHKITNFAIHYSGTNDLTPYAGLFGYVKGSKNSYAVVQNLSLDGEITMTSTGSVTNANSGAIIGETQYANLSNLHSGVNITVDPQHGGWTNLGGIVGYAFKASISGCTNSGDIAGVNTVGGIVGCLSGKPRELKDCSNSGNITGYVTTEGNVSTGGSQIGGIAGVGYTISGCCNTGTVQGRTSVGGIAGEGGSITACVNRGSITSTQGDTGGIVGNASGTITGCYNTGTVTSGAAAGIACCGQGVTISNCYNTGTVTGTGSAGYTGAVAEWLYGNSVVNHCYYLEDSCDSAMAQSSSYTGEPEAVSAETIASAEFVTSMNAGLDTPVFVSGENHPILYWERDLVVTLTSGKGYTLKGDTSVAGGESYTFTLETLSTYEKGENFAVKANGTALTPNEDGSYTIPSVTQDLTITVEGLEPITIDITVYYADNGTIVVGDDANETLLNFAPVTVSDVNDDGKFTMYDGFYCLHEQYHANGAAGYTDSNWVTQFWSVSTAMVSYGHNNRWVYSTSEEITDGDSLCLYTYQDQMSWSDLYTYFDSITATANVREEVNFHVNGYSFFGSGSNMDAIANPVGATVTATCGDKTLTTTTDAEGNFKLTFPSAGEWTILVNGKCSYTCDVGYYQGQTYTDAPVTPAMMTVTVEAPTYDVTLPEDESYTVTPCTGYTTSVKEGESFKFFVEASVGYQPGENFTVKANGETLTADSKGNYTVENVTADVTITVEGVEAIHWDPVTVYFSISHDDQFVAGMDSDEVMALRKISVPYFDLALYGLEDFYFSSETYSSDGGEHSSDLLPGTPEYAYGKITLLHLYIYALEVYYCGIDESEAGQGYLYNEGLIGTEAFSYSGSPGSIFMEQFWGMDLNLNYYVNYEYPLASEGWGSTADQILLRENAVITLGHFTSWNFFSDPDSIFNYLTPDEANKVYGSTTVTQGDKLTLNGYRAGADMTGDYTTGHYKLTSEPTIYYALYDDVVQDFVQWKVLGNLSADGTIVFDTTDLAPGTYVVAMAGQYGSTITDEICSTPGGILVVVEEKNITLGDVNGDGKVNTADAAMLYAYLNGKCDATEQLLAAADVNGDGKINTADAARIYAYVNHKIENLTK